MATFLSAILNTGEVPCISNAYSGDVTFPIPTLPELERIVNRSVPPAQNLNLSESNLNVNKESVGCSN